jgi:hypothetical protein
LSNSVEGHACQVFYVTVFNPFSYQLLDPGNLGYQSRQTLLAMPSSVFGPGQRIKVHRIAAGTTLTHVMKLPIFRKWPAGFFVTELMRVNEVAVVTGEARITSLAGQGTGSK